MTSNFELLSSENLIFSKLIFQRPLDDAQFGADTGAKFLGEDNNGIILVTGGSNITHQTNSSVYTVNPLGDIIDQKYAGAGSSGAIKLGDNIVNVDHGDAHFFASNGDSNEVTIRLIPDPNGTSTGGHLLKSYYTVNYPHGAMPPDIDIHAAKNGGYIISAVNRGSDRLISVENYDLDSTHSDSFILEGGLSQGSFEVDKEGPIIFKVDGHSNKGDLNIKLSGYPNGTYSSRNLTGDGNFSSTDGLNVPLSKSASSPYFLLSGSTYIVSILTLVHVLFSTPVWLALNSPLNATVLPPVPTATGIRASCHSFKTDALVPDLNSYLVCAGITNKFVCNP